MQNSLNQQILDPTHSGGHTLYLLFSEFDSSQYLTSWKTLPPLASTCDHCLISFSIVADLSQSKGNTTAIPNYKKGDYDAICANFYLLIGTKMSLCRNGMILWNLLSVKAET